jgi:hypothetical protein
LTGHKLTTQPDITVESSIATLDLDKILPPLSSTATAQVTAFVAEALAAEPVSQPPLKTSGHLNVGQIKHQLYQAQNLDFKWGLTDVTPDLSRVSGTATLRQGKGQIQNVEKLASVSKAVRIALFPLITLQKLDKNGIFQSLHLPSLQSIPFDSIKGDYVLKTGLMTIQTFDLSGRDLGIQTTGTVGLAGAQPLNMKVVMKMAPGSVRGTVGQLIQDENGRPTISFAATGSVADPHMKVDMQDVVADTRCATKSRTRSKPKSRSSQPRGPATKNI